MPPPAVGALLDLLAKHPQRPTLIFCNTASRANLLHRQITEEDGDNQSSARLPPSIPSLLHGGLPEKQRQSILNHFLTGQINTLICTDLASRGIDTTRVSHVVMYDFPRNAIDFIHRMGRTGRVPGTRGLVSCLVSRRDTQLAKAVKSAIKSGGSLTNHYH